ERTGSVVRGTHVALAVERSEVQAQMMVLGLTQATDWDSALERAHNLFRLKAGLLALMGALGLSVLALAQLAQRRKLRFVQMREDLVSAVSHEVKAALAWLRVVAQWL